MNSLHAYLNLQNGTKMVGSSFGAREDVSGELAFTTGMTGYTESLTDPSYTGQILIFSYPLIGNYGVEPMQFWESKKIHVRGVIVAQYNETPSHHASTEALAQWLQRERIPALAVNDTRALIQTIVRDGALNATITHGAHKLPYHDPNRDHLVREVSTATAYTEGNGAKHIVLIDCGVKRNIQRLLLARGVTVTTVPYDVDPVRDGIACDGVVISNVPGDPKMVVETIHTVKHILQRRIPVLGICLGNQILALATGGDTYKLAYGHRGQNHPCTEVGTKRSFLTTQNHGYAVGTMPRDFVPWFTNANDGTNEGIKHKRLPYMSVQFHPEASPGPMDTEWIFDQFLSQV